MDNSENTNKVKSIMKAFSLIEALHESGPLGIGELSKILSMDKATVHRIVTSIMSAGYVSQNPDTKKYANSIKFFEIGQKVIGKTGLYNMARPHMEELAELSGESVNLGILKDNQIIYIDKKEGKSPIKVGTKIGTSVPMHCTGMGKAVLSHMKAKQQEEIINRIEYVKYAVNTAMDKETLLLKLDECLKRGYSIDNEEYIDELISFGAPIFNYRGDPIAAISIACLKSRYNEKEQGKSFPLLVQKAAAHISSQMGYPIE